MAKIKVVSRKELTELINLKPATLRQWISRGEIVESQEGFINVHNIKNKDRIVNYCNKNNISLKDVFDKTDKHLIPKPKQSKQSKLVDEAINKTEPEPSTILQSQYTILRDGKLKSETEVKNIEVQLKELELSKKKAKVIPTDFSIEMFTMYIKGNINGFINNGFSIIDNLVDELEGSYETKLKYKKSLKTLFNETLKINHESISESIIERAREYALERNW